ncbi:MAG: hypothetical protein WAV28_12955 [Sedimentisphaerales bacterium]
MKSVDLLLRISYSSAVENIALSHGVEFRPSKTGRDEKFWGQQYHGVVDSSLRQGQIGPRQDGLRDK